MPAAIHPLVIAVPDADLDDLRDRLRRTRWPEPETVGDWSQGVPLEHLRELCRYWAEDYDWRATEARLNAVPQFRTEIDGLSIHFLHARSPRPDALPLVLTHGWPGSVVEYLKVVGPLTDAGFHVVVPSLPGYGFSGKPVGPGWGIDRIADAWAQLMARLGYQRYGAAGSDWGTSVSTVLAHRDPAHLAGIHLVPPLAAPDPATFDDLTPAERAALADLERARKTEDGYSLEHSTRPQTVGYGLVDSPVALCAWIVEKFHAWSDGDALSRDDLLDNLMLYWLPGTGASSARLYWESFATVQQWFTSATPDVVRVPTGCSIFPKENPRASRRWAERRFADIRHWNELDRGGHFAAFEQPELFTAELVTFFDLVRGQGTSSGPATVGTENEPGLGPAPRTNVSSRTTPAGP
ncbi:epoxide hydrolase family protein [Cryptosporangium arvum]|uniref:Putative hydrolase or acyltransferase of alpha/beta superfamily n=1 Tax=Cryptosporangium arvum DSM 44712 TaxID=927661 RepID=A0A010YMP9_9ACTN|nr:epoxide hydrolase family protein [Cryptosporangium arvum]EXG81500.1 putative hydrolase or acyltransferase of alpha/beta superfamily [Cryptosporangium arvum DSM 44712]